MPLRSGSRRSALRWGRDILLGPADRLPRCASVKPKSSLAMRDPCRSATLGGEPLVTHARASGRYASHPDVDLGKLESRLLKEETTETQMPEAGKWGVGVLSEVKTPTSREAGVDWSE